jgi:hypothetical protein
MKYLFSKSYSGRLARKRLFKTNWLGKINWRMLSHAFMVALATIGVMLLAWVGVVATLLAYGNYYR